MAERDPFREALRRADESLASMPLRREVDERVLGGAQASVEGRGRRFWLAAALVPALAILLGLWLRGGSEPPTASGGFVIEEPSEGLVITDDAEVVSVMQGHCRLRHPSLALTLEAREGTRLARRDDGARLVSGDFEIAVGKRAPDQAPVRLEVSHGTIEVMGTAFTVHQGTEGGEVTLHEGAIRFVASEGVRRDLLPGESLRWPLADEAPEPASSTSATASTTASAAPSAPTSSASSSAPVPSALTSAAVPAGTGAPAASARADELLRRVAELRSRGRYDEAEALLRSRQSEFSEETRERLSYERGSLLTYQQNDKARGCAHWAQHLATFPHGRYRADVHRAMKHLGCGKDGP
ncbi:MAG: hypothetical protein R3B72_47030 [Polyangiaceae bacterium]